jgi:predicted peptidase
MRGWWMTSLLVAAAAMATDSARSADRPAGWEADFARDEFQSGGQTLRYRLFTPEPEAQGTKPPLVIFLHGAGERGDDNAAQLKHGVVEFHKRQGQHPCVVLAPQCPAGSTWVKTDWSAPAGAGSFSSTPSPPLALVVELMDRLIASGQVDPDRIYITGLSMGGFGSWYAAAMPGSRFAAAAPICGGGDPKWAERYVGLPIWAFHGSDDRAVPVARSREMIEAIRAAGGDPKYTEYPAIGHDSWTQTYADDAFHAWLFAQRRTGP